MPVVLGLLLGASVAVVVTLIADKVWKCKEEERALNQIDKEVKLFYPGYSNSDWEYFKKPEGVLYEWEEDM